MTLKELSQLYYLNREIETDQQRLAELRAKAFGASAMVLSHAQDREQRGVEGTHNV